MDTGSWFTMAKCDIQLKANCSDKDIIFQDSSIHNERKAEVWEVQRSSFQVN